MDKHLKIARELANLLDNKFEIAGLRFGIDPLIGLVPVLGDILPAGISAYLIYVAYIYGLPKEKLLKIAGLATIDICLGFVPIVGDFIDVTYKSYQKSMEIIDEHLASPEAKTIEGERVNL